MPIRLAHTWSSDLGIPWSEPYSEPLRARGWEIFQFTPEGPHARAAVSRGERWIPLELGRRLSPIDDVRGSLGLLRQLRGRHFHIVHTHAIKVGLIARVLATAVRVPIVVHTMHGLVYSMETPPLKRYLHSRLERLANLGVSAILAQSREDAATLIESGGIGADKVIWVGNGIRLERFAEEAVGRRRSATRAALGLAAEDVLFLTAGRLVREKGLEELLEAAVSLRGSHPRLRLAIAGDIDRDKADAIDDTSLRRAQAAGVIVLGRREDMPDLLGASDVVALLSWREGMPRILMEGAAAGKALLATNVRGCREVVRDGENGLLVPVRSAPEIARAMIALAQDTGLRGRFGARNLELAREEYDVRRVVERVNAVYDRLLDEKGLGQYDARTASITRSTSPSVKRG
jgi:glycosyltransferase involved in cell wall biosynthesis